MKRVFMFAYQPCQGNTGGGHGGEYRLHEANQKYELLGEVYFVFGDRVIHGNAPCGELAVRPKEKQLRSPIKRIIKRLLPGEFFGYRKICSTVRDENSAKSYLLRLNNTYQFDDDDVFIFHDLQIARPFTKLFPFQRTMLVLHSQGSYYNEWVAYSGHRSMMLRWYYDCMLKETVRTLRFLAFPAKGAEETFIASQPNLREIVESKERRYMYSGIVCPKLLPDAQPAWVTDFVHKPGIKLVTVATLNAAKAVERIPQYLNSLKYYGVEFQWMLLGDGVKAKELEVELDRWKLRENTVWIREYVPHEDILHVLSIADFYILFHRQSVFDLSTLEAMHYGVVPILTPVGGNKDVLLDENGLFVNDFRDASALVKLIQNGELSSLKEKNRVIQREKFNDYAFLNRYAQVCEELMSGERGAIKSEHS